MNNKILYLLITTMLLVTLLIQAQAAKVMPLDKQQIEQKQSWLGVELANVPMPLARQFEHLLTNNQGLMVKSVAPDSPAAKAGIEEFDVITLFNDQKIFAPSQFQQLVQSSPTDSTVTIQIIHQGKLEKIDVKLGSRMVSKHPYRQNYQNNFWKDPHSWFNNRDNLNRQLDNFFNGFQWPDLKKQFNMSQSNSWSDFNSIEVSRLEGDRYRARVEFQQDGGDKKEFVFEGKQEEISQQIQENKDLPEDKKESLLNALNMNQGLQLPNIFNRQPGARQGYTHDPAFRQSVPPWARQYLPQ